MARPKKGTVDYFPHYVHHGKTLYILENLYGNDGYAFFYKLLEVLADSEGHFYDCRDATAWEFLQAKTHTDEVSTCSILDKLSNMGIIDPELWKIRVIWMETFVHSIKDVYLNRRVSTPKKPIISEFLHVETTPIDAVSTGENPQSKGKESKDINTLVISGANNDCPHQEIITLYHELLPMLPKVRQWTPKRQKYLRARWLSSREYQSLDWWKDFFEFVRDKCPHLTGKNDRQWTADLEWLCNESNFIKTLEGRYQK